MVRECFRGPRVLYEDDPPQYRRRGCMGTLTTTATDRRATEAIIYNPHTKFYHFVSMFLRLVADLVAGERL